MKGLTIISCLVLLACLVKAESQSERRYNGLKFENEINSYIMFKANLQPLREAFTVCSWVKKLLRTAETTPCWLSYSTPENNNEILISDDGRYNNLMLTNSNAEMSFPTEDWYHYCMSWDIKHNEKRIYFNGKVVASQKLRGNRTLGEEGYVLIGNSQNSYGGGLASSTIFGGELYKLNVFSRELDGWEIEKMYSGGLCSELEEEYGRHRYLKWEDILLEESEKVNEIKMGCGEEEEPEPHGMWDILRSDPYYNHELTEELYEKLLNGCSYEMLGDFLGATIDDSFIKHFEAYHGDY